MADLRVKVVSSIPPPQPPQFDSEGKARPQWADLTALTWAVMRKYCAKWGYSFRGDVSDISLPLVSPYVDRPASAPQSRIRYIVKFMLMLHWLDRSRCQQEYDAVVWLDSDLVIVDFDIPLTKFLNSRGADYENPEEVAMGDLIVPWDINTIHPTVIMARSTQLMRDLFWALTEAGDRLWRSHEWNDHMALKQFMHERPYRDALWQHSAQVLCAQVPGLYPPFSPLYEFKEGTSWALHLSAMSLEKRIELAQQYVEKYGLLA